MGGEMAGLVPDPTWKRINVGENWSTGDTYIAAMGQGYVLSTPLQVLVSISILANNGVYMQPTLIREVVDEQGNITQPFQPKQVWDITKDPVITVFDQDQFPTEEKKVVQPWVVQLAKQGMRMAVTEGTAERPFAGSTVESAGKTGTAEYCDNIAQSKNLCTPGNWPAHAWYVGYAPYDDPEIAVVAFVYNGGEGASVSAPIVRQVIEAYFELKAIDEAKSGS
jgi:penicillin-binding protein 2